MRELDPQTLLDLLQAYETALTELKATGEEAVAGLIERLEHRQAEALAAMADKNSEAIRLQTMHERKSERRAGRQT
jgi:hypothetical protein